LLNSAVVDDCHRYGDITPYYGRALYMYPANFEEKLNVIFKTFKIGKVFIEIVADICLFIIR